MQKVALLSTFRCIDVDLGVQKKTKEIQKILQKEFSILKQNHAIYFGMYQPLLLS